MIEDLTDEEVLLHPLLDVSVDHYDFNNYIFEEVDSDSLISDFFKLSNRALQIIIESGEDISYFLKNFEYRLDEINTCIFGIEPHDIINVIKFSDDILIQKLFEIINKSDYFESIIEAILDMDDEDVECAIRNFSYIIDSVDEDKRENLFKIVVNHPYWFRLRDDIHTMLEENPEYFSLIENEDFN